MADEYFVGLRGTDDVVDQEKVYSWRDGIKRLFPNGMTPLTGLTSMMASESTPSQRYYWWTKTLATQRYAGTAGSFIYTDALCSAALTVDQYKLAGTTLYVKATTAAAEMFRAGHTVSLDDADDSRVSKIAKVMSISPLDGTYSSIAVKLLEDDHNWTVTTAPWDLYTADVIRVVGNVNPQGSTVPEALTQGPSLFFNYTQIFRNALEITRSLRKEKSRSANFYEESKRDILEQHGIELEKAFLFGVRYAGTGSNGKPEYATGGLIDAIKTYGTNQDYSLDSATAFAGKTWLDAGEDWVDEHLEEIFRYGTDQRLALCGSGALLGIQRLIKALGMTMLTPRTTTWGLNVREWTTPFGLITLKTHPLFSYEATLRNRIVLFEPANLRYRYVDDTVFQPVESTNGFDGTKEEYFTDAGLEFWFPETGGVLDGVGVDNAVT